MTEHEAELEDFAPTPGHKQVFPVVVPLSDKRIGPCDVRLPGEIHSEIRDRELKADTWSFQRDRAQAAVSRLQRLLHGHRLRVEEAERDAFTAESQTAHSAAEVASAVGTRRRQMDKMELELKMRIQEAETQRGEAEHECAVRIAEMQMLLMNERANTAAVEGLLQQERQNSEASRKRLGEVEVQSREDCSARDIEIEKEYTKARDRVNAAQKAAADRVREAEERSISELRNMHNQLEVAKSRLKEREELEVRRKSGIEEEAQQRRGVAAARLDVDTRWMKHCIAEQQDSCTEQVGQLQKREAETKDFVESWKAGSVSKICENASLRSRQAHEREVISTQSLAHAVHTLGHHYSTQRQYNPTVDSKISKTLQGCLHGPAPLSPAAVGGAAARGCPSPRSLPPPWAHGACP